ncbi:uncharacterized protein LOC5577573 isoform X2 [Aedes aegypti]|uniref:Uncharacterized protein n=1 Tax=Aedes aegypti TaxID=7159 RepID=A0A6I8TXA5_AEDAE|nr:uncharacterized protein LOC5577573 isoform X2 [Aedes aegypti]
MNLHKLSKRHSIHSMQQQPGRQPPDEPGAKAVDAGASTSASGAASKQRKKGKFRLKERSSSSVRERFVNDPAYTEDVRHLALPMRRNSGPENVDHQQQARKFYTIPKKKSNSVGKDYLRGSGYSVEAGDVGRDPGGAYNMQVKVRRKKYNYHNSSEMLRFNADESSSSDNVRGGASGRSSTLERRGRSLDRRSACEERWFEKEGEDEDDGRGRNRNLIRRQNAAVDEGVQEEIGVDEKDGRSKLQIGKRFLKGEIGIKSFNYYLLKEGLKSSKKNLLKQRSAPAEGGAVGGGGLSKSEENIYEEIYFEEKPNDPSDEKIQFLDCELCVQQCSNSNCEACHSHVSKHKLQEHHHHQQKQLEKQNIYEQLKQIPPPPGPVAGPQHQPQYKAVKSLDIDDLNMYHSSSSTYGTATSNVLQYQSYNPNNPNVFKIETTPVAFGCEYNPIQQIYYKTQYGTLPGASVMTGQQRHHIYQQPQNLISTNSDFYQEISRKKSSSSSDSLQARMQRELYQQANLYYYQREAAAAQSVQPQDSSKIYKTSSNASILSETSARSENSLKQPRTGNMSDSSLGDSLFSYPANRRYFGSSESCRFASECRRCSLDVDKCSFSDTCRYDCRNCDCSSSYFSSDFDDTGTGRKSHSRQSGNNPGQDNYNVPAYAEDFMKHVSNVKRNQLGSSSYPQHSQQPKQTPSGKIYETPTTYAGISKKAPFHREHTYEALKSNPYGSTGIKTTHKYDENTKLSISHSHELLLSPSRNKFPIEGNYSPRLGPKSSNTLPASIPSKAKSTEFGQLPSGVPTSTSREVDTLPKSFTTTGSPRATLSNLNHDYAEITQLPSSKPKPKEQKQTPPPPLPPTSTHPKRSTIKYTAPQPPKSATTQPNASTTSARRQAPPIPTNPPLDPTQPPASCTDGRDKSLPRRDRAEFERSKRGAAAAVAATIQDVTQVPPALTPQSKRKQELSTGQQQHLAPKKELVKKKMQQQASEKEEDDGNFTDDEDDEVFLSDKVVYEKPKYGSGRKQNPPPKEQITTNKAPLVASAPTASASGQAVTGSNFSSQPPTTTSSSLSSSSSSAAPASAPQTTTTTTTASVPASQKAAPQMMARSKHREHQPEAPTTTLDGGVAGSGPASKQHSNESESLRSSQATLEDDDAAESASDLVRKSDEPTDVDVFGGGYDAGSTIAATMQLHQQRMIKTKSSPEALSTDLAVSGEASEQQQPPVLSSGRLAASAAGCSNSQDKNVAQASEVSPSHSKSKEANISPNRPDEAVDFADPNHPRSKPTDEQDDGRLIGNDECDIIDFPLPEIPVKQDPTSSDNSFLTATDGNDTAWDDAQASPALVKRSNSSEHTANLDLLKADSAAEQEMHYRNSNDKPTYLFGENLKKNEIFLNKSGWVQVSQPPQYPGDRNVRAKSFQSELAGPRTSRKYVEYNENRYGKGSKLEDLINRNEARRSQVQKVQRQDNVTILKIDPQLSSGGRPICLPIKRNLADNSPPPVTPILSPPPAFQDSTQKTRLSDIKPGTRIFLSVVDNENRNPKGMVFSRSFEYDNRRYTTPIATSQHRTQNQSYLGNFSKSFDFDTSLISPMPKTTDQPFIRRNKSPTPAFSTLTGNSPNYLTKKEKPNSNPQLITSDKSPIFPKAIPGSSVTSSGYESLKRFGDKNKSFDAQMMSSSIAAAGQRSRRSQFTTKANSTPGLPSYGFRSDSVGNNRLNSCDSGARSDYSNDGVEDDEENVSDDQSSSLALSYKSSTSYMNQMKGRAGLFGSSGSGNTLTAHSALKPQRSLTPERLYDNDEYGSMRNLKKQRSLTPEKRSRTPDDRSKPRTKGDMNSSQSSLVSRQSSGSRSSTLERRYDEAYMRTSSRSSSSSSYSGDEAHGSSFRRSQLRGPAVRPNVVAGDYKIRRSRSLQLSERSPSRQQVPAVGVAALPHKVVVRLGNIPNKERPAYTSTRKVTGSQLLTQPDSVYPRVSPSSTLDRLRRETASHTIVDVQDKSKSFDNNNYGAYEYEYDKSKSFDENYGVESDKRGYVATEGRSYSHDRVFGSTGTSSSNEYSQSSTSRNRSPQTYGSRLYEHDLQPQQQYDVSRMSRSPIINYNQRRVIARERSPVPGASKPMLGQHYQKPSDLYLMRNLTPDSEYDDRITPDFGDGQASTSVTIAPTTTAAAAAAFKEAELVKKFLYATKNKQLQRESRNVVVPPAGTPSTGSCTASSCDFWPHCGVTSTLTVEQNQLTKSGSENCLNRRSIGAGGDIASYATGLLSTSGGGTGGEVIVIGAKSGATLVPIKANSYGGVGHHPLKKQKNIEIHDRDLPTVIGGGGPSRYIYGPSRPAIVKANSITFLGEHEMPITRDRVSKSFSHQGSTSAMTTTTSSAILAKQDSTSSKSNYSLADQGSAGGRTKGHYSGSGGGGGSSNSSVKSNSSNYKVNRSPSNKSNPPGPGGNNHRYSGSGSGAGGGMANTSSVDKAGSGSDGRERKARSTYSTSTTKPHRASSSSSIKRKFEMKLKSRSLPKSFMRYSNLTSDDLELSAIFSPNSPLQLRAVSSPSLTEPTPPATVLRDQPDDSHVTKTADSRNVANHIHHHNQPQTKTALLSANQKNLHHSQQASESVLQKFKKTFSQFKPAKGVPPVLASANSNSLSSSTSSSNSNHPHHLIVNSGMSLDGRSQERPVLPPPPPVQSQQTSHHHRFGPLIWRSSKERRKTKSHRRDKCNSGDSGIQVELEADEQLLPDAGIDGTDPISPNSVTVRRANSAKVSTSGGPSLLKHKLSLKGSNKENVANISRLSGKSRSQPSGLDRLAGDDHDTRLSETDSDDENDDGVDQRRHDPRRGIRESEPVFAEVLFSFRPVGPQELALEKGALVEVLRREAGPWWWGRIKSDAILSDEREEQDRTVDNSDCGWFPMDFVKLLPTYNKPKQIIIINNSSNSGLEEAGIQNGDMGKNCDMLQDGAATMLPTELDGASAPNEPMGGASQEQTKENVIKELLETEINFVKLLNSLCLGYIKPLREREDVFPAESVNIIFSNLEKIWRFQQTFLDALRIAVPANRIGEVFLEYQSAFMIYSAYCNSYPRALMELENYTNNKEACTILESCRVSQNLPELPLSAHLLAPIQRICRYPLHLSELVKHTPTRKELLPLLNLRKCTKSDLETMDCREVFELALTAMKRVTEMVNEGKRHSEYLSRMQSRFENFQGPSINVHSTRLFLQTDAIRMTPNLWNNTYTLFLFDRQLIYCKKDLLKRTNYIYKGRIFLDNCRILNLPDGKMFGVTLKNALRLYCDTRNKWFDFCFRSSSSKLRFLNTLSAERQFCGESLFVSELDGACVDDDNLSDREYFPFNDEKEGCSNTDTETSNGTDLTDSMQFLLGNMSQSARTSNCSVLKESPTNIGGKQSGNTLPKKSRKSSKEQQQQQQPVEYNSHSLGRRKLGNWFRKAKSTNSTPSQSPTHHPMALSLAAVNHVGASDSSSASSPGLGYHHQRTLSALSTGNGSNPSSLAKDEDDDQHQLLF